MSTTAPRKKMPGVRQVVVLDNLVAVVGDHMWAASRGLDALKVTWDEGPNAKISSADIWNDLRAASKKDGVVAKSEGDIDKGLTQGERFDADYELPLLAHATMEPMNCTVRLTSDACDIWTGTQVQTRVSGICGQGRGPADRQGDRQQPLPRRRLRPPARAGHGRERSAYRQKSVEPDQGRVDTRRGHAARRLSAGSIATRFRRLCRTGRSMPGSTR